MSLNAYLTIKGARQGNIAGSVTQKGRENQIMVIAVNHEITTPRDPASGLPTGKRMHKPIVITKQIDKSTPLLYNALVNNENLTEVTLRFWAPNIVAAASTGQEVQNYTIVLTNANIASISTDMMNNATDVGSKLAVMETIAFTYQKIQWTWNDGGITSGDDWSRPVV